MAQTEFIHEKNIQKIQVSKFNMKASLAYKTFIALIISLNKLLFNLFFKDTPPPKKALQPLVWGSGRRVPKSIPKIIWTYWDGPPSPCAEACLKRLKEENSWFEIIDLNNDNISKYIHDTSPLSLNIPIQLKSDYIRLSILERYGGIWVDRSIIVTESFEWVLDCAKGKEIEAIFFYNEFSKFYYKSSSRPVIENGFIAATKESRFIKEWLLQYKACIQNKNWTTYFMEKPNHNELVSNFKHKAPSEICYFSCYIAAQKTMLESNNYRLLLLNAEDDFYYYLFNTSRPFNRINLCLWILLSRHISHPSRLVKLTRRYREMADIFIELNIFNTQSLLGRYLKAK
jgi:hypothetical protein